MATRKITIEVSEEVARAYKNASPEKRKRAQRAVAYSLMSGSKAANVLKNTLDRTGKAAEERGLTEDALKELFNED